mmetsp:Transcript_23581/g.57105  ORF Transcript_23581/g.57105 Transcript_23581/m.57105 type:complete len:225 (-) Transcript_23581:994-1668(-)
MSRETVSARQAEGRALTAILSSGSLLPGSSRLAACVRTRMTPLPTASEASSEPGPEAAAARRGARIAASVWPMTAKVYASRAASARDRARYATTGRRLPSTAAPCEAATCRSTLRASSRVRDRAAVASYDAGGGPFLSPSSAPSLTMQATRASSCFWLGGGATVRAGAPPAFASPSSPPALYSEASTARTPCLAASQASPPSPELRALSRAKSGSSGGFSGLGE